MLAARVAYGAGLLIAPERLARRWLGPQAAYHPTQVPLRGLGAREVAIHGAGVIAALRGEPLRPYFAASIAGDLTDITATAIGRDELPDGSAAATLAVAGGSALISAAAALAADR